MFTLVLLTWCWFCGGAAVICVLKDRHPKALLPCQVGMKCSRRDK